ncbi:hypothetical protein [Chryseobacterium gossypii]|uniref:hypothetical protein n=1 Tax=Chryseobacterium gossypii TaxID=3231602 RepID=UPI003524DD2C
MRQNNFKEFVLENVTIGQYYYVYVIGLPLFLIVFFLYGEYGMGYFGILGLILAFAITFGGVYFVLKKLSKRVTIRIDDKYLIINDKKYTKEEVKGIYSYDYINTKKSIISIQIQFTDGKKIEITDTEYRNKYDENKASVLRSFLKNIIEKFDFAKKKKNKLRAVQNLGAYWYSK